MNIFLTIAFLFYAGAILGWCLEFLFRNLISHKGPRGKYFINPGFCKGPWLPIYGIGLSAMCIISYFVAANNPGANDIVVILIIGVVMNCIEFIGGLFLLKVFNLRLWDYRERWGNIMGIVCPLFALIWFAISAVYYLFIHQTAMGWLDWLSKNLAFSFVVGLFWGLFIIDLIYSFYEASIIKEFADNHDVIVKYEELKELIQKARIENGEKSKIIIQTSGADGASLQDSLEQNADKFEGKATAFKSKRAERKNKRASKKNNSKKNSTTENASSKKNSKEQNTKEQNAKEQNTNNQNTTEQNSEDKHPENTDK